MLPEGRGRQALFVFCADARPVRDPVAVNQHLGRLKSRFVVHLRAVFNPVAQVEILQIERLRLFDLPDDVVVAITCIFDAGVVEGVDRAQAIIQHVDDRDDAQRAIGLAKLHQAGVDSALQQKLRILIAAILIHAASRVAHFLILQIQFIVLRGKSEARNQRAQIAMLGKGPLMAAGRLILLDWHTQRDASAAAVAMRPVSEYTTATKTGFDQLAINIGVDQMIWSGHLRARLLTRQIAAGVRCRGIKLQRGKWEFVEFGHQDRVKAAGGITLNASRPDYVLQSSTLPASLEQVHWNQAQV
jgi:hypothetical protein